VIDFSFSNSKLPDKGSVLISNPFMDEDYFRRSVILLCGHDEHASFGFVLTNYLDVDLHKLDPTFPDINTRISIGGPVETQHLYYIHAFNEPIEDSMIIREGLYFGGSFEYIKLLLEKDNSNRHKIRFFLGYSGWNSGQLVRELKEKSWIVADNLTNEEILSTTNNHLWHHSLEKQGGHFKLMTKFPLNPGNN
jgi:putative transcriptional regulator